MEMVAIALLLLLACLSAVNAGRLRTFHKHSVTETWQTAESACKRNASTLVVIYNEQDTELIHLDPTWIGLERRTARDKWSNGDAVKFQNWTENCTESSCCAAMNKDGGWSYKPCLENRSFMCYTRDSCVPSYPYLFIQQSMTWYEAQTYCRTQSTDLVSIRDEEQNEEVLEKGKNSPRPFWIGMLHDDWEWVDGSKSVYRNWKLAEQQGNYAYMRGQGWYGQDSNSFQPFVCQKVKMNFTSAKMTWEDGEDYCRSNHADLLRIESLEDQEQVQHELRRLNVSDSVWIGLTQSRLLGFWIWSSGRIVRDYSNWAGGTQPGRPMSQSCGVVAPGKGFTWIDEDCRAQHHVLCEVT